MMSYKPTQEALRKPRRVFLNGFGWVGIGGSISINQTPPKLPATIVIPEATAEQYEKLYNIGYRHLIYAEPVASQESNPRQRKRRKASPGDVS